MNKPTPGTSQITDCEISEWLDATAKLSLFKPSRGIIDAIRSRLVMAKAIYEACRSINPSNPLAVAEALPQLIWVLRNIENDDGHIPSTIWSVRNAALAKIEGKP